MVITLNSEDLKSSIDLAIQQAVSKQVDTALSDTTKTDKILSDTLKQALDTSLSSRIQSAIISEVRQSMKLSDSKEYIRTLIVEKIQERFERATSDIDLKFQGALQKHLQDVFGLPRIELILRTVLREMMHSKSLPLTSIIETEILKSELLPMYLQKQVESNLSGYISNIVGKINKDFSLKVINDFLRDYFKKENTE